MRYKRNRNRMLYMLCAGGLCCLLVAGGFLALQKRAEKEDPENKATEVFREAEPETAGEEKETVQTERNPDEEEAVQAKQDTEEDLKAVEAALIEQESQRIQSLPAGELAAEGVVPETAVSRLFYAAAVDEAILERMQGKSYTPNEHIQPSELSYLRMLYYGADGNTYVGEMVVNQAIEEKVLEIFRKLYENRYPIERMVLVDEYNADDEASMEDNNTSAFNYRNIAGSSRLSNHSYGMAIDLNPKYNPYVKTLADGSILCQPQGSDTYADRTKEFAFKIDREDLAFQLFTQAGFTWGGDWSSVKDYQHFEMEQ